MNSWIGVDLDGTLAHYEGFGDGKKIGENNSMDYEDKICSAVPADAAMAAVNIIKKQYI